MENAKSSKDPIIQKLSNEAIFEYLIHEGYFKTAKSFAASSGLISKPSELEFKQTEQRMTILEAFQENKYDRVLEHLEELSITNEELKFRIHHEILLKMILDGVDAVVVVEYARTHLSQAIDTVPELREILELVMSLLLFDSPSVSPALDALKTRKNKTHAFRLLNQEIIEALRGTKTEPRIRALIRSNVYVTL